MENIQNITFDKLNLSKSILSAITKKGFKTATEIQAKVIPIIFEQKNDIIGIAQTGTGKTGAFGLPLIDLIKEKNKFPQAIILAPTRELALQITSELEMFSSTKKLNILTVYGGSSINNQIKALRRGVDIVVGTPGRVVDLLKRKDLVLKESHYFILDEADEMLKMGFIEDIEFILSASSKEKKVYLFSATVPDRIKQLSKKYMKDQKIIEVKNKLETNKLIEQFFCKAKQSEKFDALVKLIDMVDFFYGIIFCRTKADVDNISSALKKKNYDVGCIHGDIAQSSREKILKKFKDSKLNILVATDVAARGIDVENLTHVINYNLPEDSLTYTHRIGRTGRAGNTGIAISLVTPSEMRKMSQFEKELKVQLKPIKLPSEKEIKEKNSKKTYQEIEKIVQKANINSYLTFADELLSKYDALQLVSAFLYKIDNGDNDNKFSDSKKYDKYSSKKTEKRFANEDIRIFIAKGRMDKFDKKGLINFIERETKIKLGKIRDVKVCDKFSFLTLNANEAHNVIDAFETQNRRRPLAEIAQK